MEVDTIGTYDFWIVAYARGGAKKSYKVTVTVDCGDEVVEVDPTEITKVYPRDDVSTVTPIKVESISTAPSYFYAMKVTNLYCPLTTHKIWD